MYNFYYPYKGQHMKYKTDYYESMRGEDGRFHFIYKMTNIINKKYYIGAHSTYDLGDGYKGSGTILNNAYKKYGKKSFKRDILQFYKNRDELFKAEREIINNNIINDPQSYNVAIGGIGFDIGKATMINMETGNIERVNIDNELRGSKYISINKNTVPVYDMIEKKYKRVKKSDYDTECHINMHKGKIVLYNTILKKFEMVGVDDPRRRDGILISPSKNMVTVHDEYGNYYQVSKNDPDYLSGKLKIYSKGKWTLRNKITGKCISIEKDSEVDWNIYEYCTCRLKNKDNPNKIYAKLIGEKRYKWYDNDDIRFETMDLLKYTPGMCRNNYYTNGIIEIALHKNEIDNFLKYHKDWYKGRKKIIKK
jgi:hypothetical protein